MHNIDPDYIVRSLRPQFVFPQGDSIRIIIGRVTTKQIGYSEANDGVFFAKMKADGDSFAVVNYGKIFITDTTSVFNLMTPFQRENGNWVVVNNKLSNSSNFRY